MIDQMETEERIYIHASETQQAFWGKGYEIPLLEARGRVEIVSFEPVFGDQFVLKWRPLEPGAELVPVNRGRLL